jgi:hypothetical protein
MAEENEKKETPEQRPDQNPGSSDPAWTARAKKRLKSVWGVIDKNAAGLALLISILSFINSCPPVERFFRGSDISILAQPKSVVANYEPQTHKLTLHLDIPVSNSGSREGALEAASGRLADSQEQSSFIPFYSGDIALKIPDNAAESSSVVIKADGTPTVTCKLDYEIGEIGQTTLFTPGPKVLTVRFLGNGKSLVVWLRISTWDPDFLHSKSNEQRIFHE